MVWQRIINLALVISCHALAGCASTPSSGLGAGLGRDQLLQDPELMSTIARNGSQGVDAVRAQKPDVKTPSALLDITPVRLADAAGSQSAVTICAVVNDQAIFVEEVQASIYRDLIMVRGLPEPERSQRTAQIFNESLNQIVEREIVLQDAFTRLKNGGPGGEKFIKQLQEAASKEYDNKVLKPIKSKTGLKSDEEIKRFFIDEFGVSLECMRRQWERNFMQWTYLRERVNPIIDRGVSHQMLVDYYENHPEDFQVSDSVEWQDLFIASSKYGHEKARTFATSLAEQARQGADFAKLVKQYDDGDSSLRDGDGVGRKRGEIKPREAEEPLFSLAESQVGPVIEIETGFHVIKVVKRQHAGQLPFDEKVQKQIKDKLRNAIAQREIKRIIAELKQKAVVEYSRKVN